MRFTTISTSILAFITLAAVQGNSAPAKAAQIAEGKKVYEINCLPCHGVTGAGDGAAAVALNPKPRNFTDAAYMKKRPVDSLRIVIKEGGQVAGLSPVMVGWKAILKPDQIENVLQYVLSLSKGAKPATAKKAK